MTTAVERVTSEYVAGEDLGPLRLVQFTFEVRAGALRRRQPDDIARKMHAAGLEVAWTDRRAGLFGIRRRFTIDGSAWLVRKLIGEIGATIGWSPGAIAVPHLAGC